MNTLHPVESIWRRFRKSERDLFERCLKQRRTYLDSVDLKDCPVPLPGDVPWNVIASAEAQARGERDGSPSRPGALLSNTVHSNTVHVWAAYRQSKTIYEVDPLLAQCLARSPWPASTPTAALRLPSLCPVITLPLDDPLGVASRNGI
jgi:hypothetical protein